MGIFDPKTEHIGTDELYPDWMQGDVKNVAQNIANLQTPEYYNQSTLAPLNQEMNQSLQNMQDWGQPGGIGHSLMVNQYTAGQDARNFGLGGGMDYMNQMQAQGPNQFQYDQGTFDQTMGNLAPGVQNMFDANAGSMQRNFDFNQLPGLKMSEGLAGGYGSTKGGQQSALASALNAGNIQQMGVGLWNNAANQAQSGAMQGGMSNLGSANNFDSNMMSNYGNYGQMGNNMVNDAYGMGRNNMQIGQTGAGIQQSYDQQVVDADKARWDYEQNKPWMDQEQRQKLTQGWQNGNAIQYGDSPFNQVVNGVTGLAGLYAGIPPGTFGGGGGGGNQDMFFGGGWNGNSNGYW